MLIVALVGIGWLVLQREPAEPWPEPPRPAPGAQLDPALEERIDEALAALEADPGQARVRARLGMLYEANELYPLAVETYGQLLYRFDARGELHYRSARSLERDGRLDEAISALENAVARIETPGRPHDLLVDWLLQAGRTSEAESVVSAAGADALPLAHARVLASRGQLDEAQQVLESSGLTEGDDARLALFLLAQVQRQRGDIEAARTSAERAATAPPVPVHPWDRGMSSHQVGASSLRLMARAQLERGDIKGALLSLQELRDQPGGEDPRIASLMAQAYLRLGRPDVAVELLEGVVAANPEDFQTHLNLVKSSLLAVGALEGEARGQELERALLGVSEALRLRPESAQAWSTKGQVLEAAGRLDEALAAYEESWTRDESDPTARVRAAWIHMARSQWQEARDLLVPLTESRGAVPSALLGRAHAEAELGHLDQAAELLSWIGERLPDEQIETTRARLRELGAPDE